MIYPKYKSKARREKALARVAKREVPAATDWETLRPLILAKSDGCYLCGRPLTLETMTTDHMNIEAAGMPKNDEFANLMPCCFYCNSAKGSRRIDFGYECPCGQEYLVKGLGCLRCKYGKPLPESGMPTFGMTITIKEKRR